MSKPQPPVTEQEFRKKLLGVCQKGGRAGLPRKHRVRHIFLRAVAQSLGDSNTYSEKDLNRTLEDWLACIGSGLDHVALRRSLVDEGYLERDRSGSEYRVCLGGRGVFVFEFGVRNTDAIALVRQAREDAAARKRRWTTLAAGVVGLGLALSWSNAASADGTLPELKKMGPFLQSWEYGPID